MGIEREEKILQCLVLVKSAGKRNGVTVTSGLMCSQICRFIYSFILTKVESSKSDTHCNVITHPLTVRGGRGECGCRMGTKSTKACSKEREERKYTERFGVYRQVLGSVNHDTGVTFWHLPK